MPNLGKVNIKINTAIELINEQILTQKIILAKAKCGLGAGDNPIAKSSAQTAHKKAMKEGQVLTLVRDLLEQLQTFADPEKTVAISPVGFKGYERLVNPFGRNRYNYKED
jgi:hypothetical protein